MLHFYYSFTNPQSEEIPAFLENASDGEILLYPYEGKKPQKNDILISDDADVIRKWQADGGLVIGYEHDGIRPETGECITDISEVYAEDLSEIADYLTESRHLLFFSGNYDFYTPGFEDYKSLYKQMQGEAYLLSSNLKNLSDEELHDFYQNSIHMTRMNPALAMCAYTAKDSDRLLGQVSVEVSDLTDKAYNLSYYLAPDMRAQGIGTSAVKAFLARMLPRLDKPLLAVIHRSNSVSVAVAKACGFTVLPANQQILVQRPEGFLTMIYENSADA